MKFHEEEQREEVWMGEKKKKKESVRCSFSQVQRLDLTWIDVSDFQDFKETN